MTPPARPGGASAGPTDRRHFLRTLTYGSAVLVGGCGGAQRRGPATPLEECLDRPAASHAAPTQTLPLTPRPAGWPQWPTDLAPAQCPIYVRNELLIPAPPQQVWQWLCRADLWPVWFPRISRVHFVSGGPTLDQGSVVGWRMLGANLRVTIKRCDPSHVLAWEGGDSAARLYREWLLLEQAGQTRLLTDETERGLFPSLFRLSLRGSLHKAQQEWLASLARVVTCGEPDAVYPV